MQGERTYNRVSGPSWAVHSSLWRFQHSSPRLRPISLIAACLKVFSGSKRSGQGTWWIFGLPAFGRFRYAGLFKNSAFVIAAL